MHRHRLTYLILLTLFTRAFFAQGVPPVEPLSGNQLAHDRAWMIAKGCDGFLYVANDKGVLIFNGFTTHLVELPNHVKARSVFTGQDCRVYVGGYQNFGYLEERENRRPVFVSLADDAFKGSNEEIWQIFANDEYTVFQSFSAVFTLRDGVVDKVNLPSTIMLGREIGGKLLIPDIGGKQLYELSKDTFRTKSFGKVFSDKKISAIAHLPDGEDLLIATQHEGLFRFTGDTVVPIATEVNLYAARYQLNRVLRLHNGDYAFGTILNGVYITDESFRVKHHINQLTGLADNTVLSLFEDENDLLFIGMDQGVNTLAPASGNRHYHPERDYGRIYSAVEHQGAIYLATNRGVFRQSGLKTELVAGTQGQAWKLHPFGDELLCAHNRGTLLIEDDGASIISGPTGTWWLQTMNDSTIMQSTYTGLSVLSKGAGSWRSPQRIREGDLHLIKFYVSPTNRIVGIHPHIGYYTGTLSPGYDQLEDQARHLTEDSLENIAETEILFVGQTVYFLIGGNFYEHSDTGFTPATAHSPDHPLLETLKCRLKHKGGSKDELVFSLSDTTYLFPTDYGFYILNKIEDCSLPLRETRIQYYAVNDALPQQGDSIITLRPNFKRLSIQLQKNIATRGNFQYLLKGWNTQWTPLGNEGEIVYENIKPGTYELLLEVPEGEARRLATVVVSAPWHQTTGGYLFFVAMGLLLLFLLKRYSDQQMKRQARQLQLETERKLKEVSISNENRELQQALIHKSEQLANSAMMLVKRDKLLNELKQSVKKLKLSENQATFKEELVRKISQDTREDWALFQTNFNAVHQDFFTRLSARHPALSNTERQLAAYIRMDLRSKEIAPLFNISIRSLENKRYRLRQSLGLDQGENLKEYLQQL